MVKYTIIGGGLAGGSAIEELINQGVPGSEIQLIAYEPELPYSRPPLSKGFLAGREDRDSLLVKPKDFYTEHDINLQLHTKVTRLNAKERFLYTEHGQMIEFNQLLLASGTRPRKIQVPGSDLKNILYLRTIYDGDAMKKSVKPGAKVVVVGAGFIGLEVAATLTDLGCEVTVLHRGTQLLDRFSTSPIAKFFHDFFISHGVSIRYERTVDSFLGTDERVTQVVTDHNETLEADCVVVGVGVELNLNYINEQHIRCANGIVVDEELETAIPGIFAAGDIVNFPDVIFDGRRRRIEHWDHAIASAQVAARNILGRHEPFRHLSMFYSDMFEISFDLWGDTDEPDEVIFQGSQSSITASAWYIREGKLAAYFALNRPDQEKEAARNWITAQQPVDRAAIDQYSR